MLEIQKEEPDFFTIYKKKNKPHSYQDDCNDHRLRNDLRESLLQEQKNQCFYCEKKISNDTDKVHLDHLKQRDPFHELECNYANMVLSCNGGAKEEYCGKYKDNQESWNDDKFLRILPLNPQLEEKSIDALCYISNGEIQPKKSLSPDSQKRASNTINYLNLNHKNLIKARKNIFLQLELYKTNGFQIDEIFTYFQEFESLFKDI